MREPMSVIVNTVRPFTATVWGWRTSSSVFQTAASRRWRQRVERRAQAGQSFGRQ